MRATTPTRTVCVSTGLLAPGPPPPPSPLLLPLVVPPSSCTSVEELLAAGPPSAPRLGCGGALLQAGSSLLLPRGVVLPEKSALRHSAACISAWKAGWGRVNPAAPCSPLIGRWSSVKTLREPRGNRAVWNYSGFCLSAPRALQSRHCCSKQRSVLLVARYFPKPQNGAHAPFFARLGQRTHAAVQSSRRCAVQRVWRRPGAIRK